MIRNILLAAFGLAIPALGAPSALLDAKAPAECRERLDAIGELEHAERAPGWAAFVKTGKAPNELLWEIGGWSTDLLVKLVLAIEQEYGGRCAIPPKLGAFVETMKDAYLAKLGAPQVASAEERRRWFRGLLVLKDDVPRVKKQVDGQKLKNVKAIPGLAKVFGFAAESHGVVIVGGRKAEAKALERLVDSFCGGEKRCRFWNGLALYKVVLTKESGVAAYVPELALLVLSTDLLGKPKKLHRVVVAHELAHVAERTAALVDGGSWTKDFLAFSGWREEGGKWMVVVDETAGNRDDALTRESVKSPYSILPDPVVLGMVSGAERLDGFVFAKGHREALARNDPAEDLADHVAAFLVAPERFCAGDRAVAPHKWEWVRSQVFGGRDLASVAAKLSCRPGLSKGP